MAKKDHGMFGVKRSTLERNTRRSQDWLMKKLKKVDKEFLRSQPLIGSMMLFTYDPKHKATLPFWDRNPLVIFISKKGQYALGLNLHYLPPRLRLVLLNKLMKFVNNKNLSERSRFRMTYEMLKGTSGLKMFKPTLKLYIRSHVKSPYLLVPPDQWTNVVSLPLARFNKKSNQAVYADSRKKI
jgi:hypothetical protein